MKDLPDAPFAGTDVPDAPFAAPAAPRAPNVAVEYTKEVGTNLVAEGEAALNLATGLGVGFPVYLMRGVIALGQEGILERPENSTSEAAAPAGFRGAVRTARARREQVRTEFRSLEEQGIEPTQGAAGAAAERATYQPKTVKGKALTDIMNTPLHMLAEKSKEIGESVTDYYDSPVAGALTESFLQMAAPIGVVKGAGGIMRATPKVLGTLGRKGASPQDFHDAGAVLEGKAPPEGENPPMAEKLQKIYDETGKTPAEVIQKAAEDTNTMAELVADNVDVPAALREKGPTTETGKPEGEAEPQGAPRPASAPERAQAGGELVARPEHPGGEIEMPPEETGVRPEGTLTRTRPMGPDVPISTEPLAPYRTATAAELIGEIPKPAGPTITPEEIARLERTIGARHVEIAQIRQTLTIEHPEVRTVLQGMADNEAGWAQIGGRHLGGQMGTPNFSTWIPKAEWWPERPDKKMNESSTRAAVRKALAGEKLKPIEQRAVDSMLDIAKDRVASVRRLGPEEWQATAADARAADLEATTRNVLDVDTIARAAAKDEAAVEKAAAEHEQNYQAFMDAITEIDNEAKPGTAADGRSETDALAQATGPFEPTPRHPRAEDTVNPQGEGKPLGQDLTSLPREKQPAAIGKAVHDRLLELGVDEAEAAANAALWEKWFKVAGEKYDVPPAEILARYGVDVRRMGAEGEGGLDQVLQGEERKPPAEFAQSTATGPTFYSELARQLEASPMKQGNAKAWKDYIKSLAGKGVKAEEVRWSGIEDWLDAADGRITKEQVTAFLEQGGVKTEETVLGGHGDTREYDRLVVELDAKGYSIIEDPDDVAVAPGQMALVGLRRRLDGQRFDISIDGRHMADDPNFEPFVTLPGDIQAMARQLQSFEAGMEGTNPGDARYSSYTLPGGENYRELLLTLPERTEKEGTSVRAERLAKEAGEEWDRLGPNGRQIFYDAADRARADFRSSHFDQPNILAHVRFNERTDAEGKKVLFIEEIQSDWAQKGMRMGFAGELAPLPKIIGITRTGDHPAGQGGGMYDVKLDNGRTIQIGSGDDTLTEVRRKAETSLQHEAVAQSRLNSYRPPAAPFVGKTEAWVALALKRMIRYASENGFDRVAWTTGEQQADRYDLSKHISTLTAQKVPSGRFHVEADDLNGKPVIGQDVTPEGLPDVVGKDLAAKIIAEDGGKFSGLDLKVGGEGMRAFYDKIVPNVANDVLKKLGGGKVGEVGVGSAGGRYAVEPIEQVNRFRVVDYGQDSRGSGVFVTEPLTHDAAQSWISERQPSGKQMGFDITPALKERALEGLPLFQAAKTGGERGKISFGDASTVISLLQNADRSTFLHESGHFFLQATRDLATAAEAPAGAKADWAKLSDWLDLKEGEAIPVEAHEKFAEGFEQYLAEGKAPSPELRGVFQQFRDWLLEIYKSVRDVGLTDEVRGVFDRMLKSQKEDPVEPPASPPGPPPPRPAGSPEPTDAQRQVLERISQDPAPKRRYTWEEFYADVKDDLWPIKRLVDALKGGEDLTTATDPYKLARLTRGSYGKAEQFLEYSPFDFNTYRNVGKSLRDIVAPVEHDLDGLRAYAVSRRAIELAGREIETGVPIEAARQVVAEGEKYAPVLAELKDYQDHLVTYMQDAGILKGETVDAMREANKDYVPFFRLMDDAEGGAQGAGSGLKVHQPIKRIKGSERKIIDPLESIVKNTYLYITLAERNAVGEALIKLVERSGREDLVRKIPAPVKPIVVLEPEIRAFLEENGITLDSPIEEAMTIFRRGNLTPAEDQIVVYREGKREVYQVPPEVATAFKATDRETAGMLMRVLAIPAKLLRVGATLSPDFISRNPVRDQFSAYVLSKSRYVPILDMVRGAVSIGKHDADFQNWLKSGGANAAMVSLDRDYVQQALARRAGDLDFADKAWNIVKNPLEPLRIVSELMENATRLGEFKRAAEGLDTKEAIQAAGYEAREVTIDFARIGARTRSMNLITAFWNANLEGADRVVRAFGERPIQMTAKVAASITLPSVLLWWANHDDPRWKEIPNWQRDLFWIVLTKDHIYRIPKPFELGVIFGSSVERLLDAFVDAKPEAFKDFTSSMINTMGINLVPTVAAPILGQIVNWNFFTDRPLIPASQERLLPEYQYSSFTTQTTRALGHLVGMIPGAHDKSMASPQVIDNYIRSWTGTLGNYALQIADAALRKTGVLPDPIRPAKTLEDMPVLRGFMVRYPSGSAQSIQDFYDAYDKSKKVTDTIKYLAQHGDATAAIREMKLDQAKLLRIEGIHEALGKAQQVVQLVDLNQTIKAEEKRQLIDTVYFQMIGMSRAGNQALAEMKKVIDSMPKTPEPVH